MASPPSPSSLSSFEKGDEIEPSFNETLPRKSWFHSVFFNITIVGMCAFLSPGIWNSMSSLGAGGRQEPYLVNAANALVYGMMVVTCFFGSYITSKIGYRWSVVLGCVGYFPYATGLYENKMKGTEWLVLFGSFLCGTSAGLFWSVEGAIVMGYPEPSKRGRYLAFWLAFRNAGSILGGAINLALNVKNAKGGSVSSSTYPVFIVLQAIAPFVGYLISNPSQVWRPDATPVRMEKRQTFRQEMRDLLHLVKRKEILLLFPIALYAQWCQAYAGTFATDVFSVRTRALGSFLLASTSVIANGVLGFFLDGKSLSKKFKARSSFLAIMSVLGGVWVWYTVLQLRYIHHPFKLDWTDGHRFGAAFALHLIFNCFYYLLQNELYWTISQVARGPTELLQLSSLLRGLESAGAACGFGVSARKTLPRTIPLGINFALWGISSIAAWFTVKDIGVKFGLDEKRIDTPQDTATVKH
ncbi:uncharacterized protein JCM15063_000329 [Sporobolomyces koalae]|uniref:uncharacterized protein n=1 Tax=Sporobolomyces koalae TaxID=500713 RepID=UPI00317F2A9D